MVILPERFGWNSYFKGTVEELPFYLYDRLMFYLEADTRAKNDWQRKQEAELRAKTRR